MTAAVGAGLVAGFGVPGAGRTARGTTVTASPAFRSLTAARPPLMTTVPASVLTVRVLLFLPAASVRTPLAFDCTVALFRPARAGLAALCLPGCTPARARPPWLTTRAFT